MEEELEYYSLSEKETAILKRLQAQHTEVQAVIQQCEEAIVKGKTELTQIQGAVNGIALMLASQQGFSTEKSGVQFNSDFTQITVSTPKEETS